METTFNSLLFAANNFELTGFSSSSSVTPIVFGRDEAFALVKLALTFQETKGLKLTLLEANKADGQFSFGNLFVMAYDTNGTALAHRDPAMVGKNLIRIRDARGIFFNREFINLARKDECKGWVKYQLLNKSTKLNEAMEAYVEKIGEVYWVCSYPL